MSLLFFLHSFSFLLFCFFDWTVLNNPLLVFTLFSSTRSGQLWKLSLEFFSRVIVFFCSNGLWALFFSTLCFFFELVLFMHCFPNFVQLSVCSYSSLNKRFILNSRLYSSCISIYLGSAMERYQVLLVVSCLPDFFLEPCFLALVAACVSNWPPLPCFTGLLWQGKSITFELGLLDVSAHNVHGWARLAARVSS